MFSILLTFSTVLCCEFVWLDHSEIEDAGYRVNSLDDLRRVFTTSLDDYQFRHGGESDSSGGYWRPLYALSISVDWWLWGNNPVAFHAENVIWHCLVVLLLHRIGGQILPRKPWTADAVFLSTFLFATLPINAQSVTWVSGRKDMMAAAFGLLALYRALSVDAATSDRTVRRRIRNIVEIVLAVSCSVLSKESGFIIPVIYVALLWTDTSRLSVPVMAGRFTAMLVTTATLWLIRGTITGSGELTGVRPGNTVVQQALTLASLWWHHVSTVFWPFSPRLSDRWEVAALNDPVAWLALLGVLLIVVFFGIAFRQRFSPATGLVWYTLWTLPTSGILTLRHWRAERYLYPASWGLILFAITILYSFSMRSHNTAAWNRRIVRCSLCLVIVFALTSLWDRQYWVNDAALFTRAVYQDPLYLEGHAALAALSLGSKDYDSTISHSEVIFAQSDHAHMLSYWSPYIVYTNCGLACYHVGRLEQSEQYFELARQLQPNQATSYYHPGLVALKRPNYAEAERLFRRAFELNPNDPLIRSNLAFSLLQTHRPDAIRECMELLEPTIGSETPPLDLRNYGSAALVLKLWPRAEVAFQEIIRQQQATAADMAKLAWAHFESGDASRGFERLREAVELDPKDPAVLAIRQKYGREETNK